MGTKKPDFLSQAEGIGRGTPLIGHHRPPYPMPHETICGFPPDRATSRAPQETSHMSTDPDSKVPNMTFPRTRLTQTLIAAALLAGALQPAMAQQPAPEITYGPNELMYKHIWEDVDARIGAMPGGLLFTTFTTNDNWRGWENDDDIFYSLSGDNGQTWGLDGTGPSAPSAWGLHLYDRRTTHNPPDMDTDTKQDFRPSFAVNPTTGTVIVAWSYRTDPEAADADILIARSEFPVGPLTWDNPIVDPEATFPDNEVPARLALNRRYYTGDSASDLFPAVASTPSTGFWFVGWQTDHPTIVQYRINDQDQEVLAPGFPQGVGTDFDIFYSLAHSDGALIPVFEEPGDGEEEPALIGVENSWADPFVFPGQGPDDGDDVNLSVVGAPIAGVSLERGEIVEPPGAEGFVAVYSSNDDFDGLNGRDRDILYAVMIPLVDEFTGKARAAFFASQEILDPNAFSDSNVDDFPQIAYGGDDTFVTVWISTAQDGLQQRNILASVSRDGPFAWEPPVRLNSDGTRDNILNTPPRIATDGNGTWVVTWRDGAIGQPPQINYVYSTDNALSWSSPKKLDDSVFGEGRIFEDLAYNPGAELPDGTIIEPAWVASYSTNVSTGLTRGTTTDIFVSVLTELECEINPTAMISCWDRYPVKIDDDLGFDGDVDVRTDGGTTLLAAWSTTEEYYEGEFRNTKAKIVYSRSVDDGAVWTNPEPLFSVDSIPIDAEEFVPRVAHGRNGRWLTSFFLFEDDFASPQRQGKVLIAHSLNNGETFEDGPWELAFGLSGAGSNEYPFGVKLDGGDDRWLIAWQSTDPIIAENLNFPDDTIDIGSDSDILFTTSFRTNQGERIITNARRLNTNALTDVGDDTVPHLLRLGAFQFMCVWVTEDTFDGTIGTDADLVYAISVDDGETWSSPRVLNNNAGFDNGFDLAVSVAFDSVRNRLVAVWSTTDSALGGGGADLLAESDVVYAISTDRGSTWSDPVRIGGSDSDTDFDEAPEIRFDPRGEWIVTWTKSNSLKTASEAFYSISRDGVNWSPEKPVLEKPAARGPLGGEPGSPFTPGIRNNAPSLAYNSLGQWITMWGSNQPIEGNLNEDFDIIINRSEPKGSFVTSVTEINRTVLVGNDLPNEEIIVRNTGPRQSVEFAASLDSQFAATVSTNTNNLPNIGDIARITIDYDRIDFVLLGPGVYTAQLFISAPDMYNSPFTIPITVTVLDEATPSPTPSATATPTPSPTPITTPIFTTATPTRTPLPPTRTPTPTPSPTLQATDVEFLFQDNAQEWRFSGQVGSFTAPAHQYNINRESLDLTSTSSDNNFGFWQSPLFKVVGSVGTAPEATVPVRGMVGESQLFRATFQVASDFANPNAMPSLRFRASTSDFHSTVENLTTSTANAANVPTAAGRLYSQVFSLPANRDQFLLYYDLLNFTGDATGVTFNMPRATVEYLGPREWLSAENVLLSESFLDGQTRGFATSTAEPLGVPAGFLASGEGLGIRGADSLSSSPAVVFGSWVGNRPGLPLSSERLYEIRWTVGTNASAAQKPNIPTFRLRVNDQTFQTSALLSINSLGNNPRLPVAGTDEVYSLWMQVPQGLVNNGLIFSFDYLYSNSLVDDPTISLFLKKLELVEYDPTFLFLAEP